MSPLPNCEEAVIEDSKFVSYALNPQSELGQHKARAFESALGFNLSNWEQLTHGSLKFRAVSNIVISSRHGRETAHYQRTCR